MRCHTVSISAVGAILTRTKPCDESESGEFGRIQAGFVGILAIVVVAQAQEVAVT